MINQTLHNHCCRRTTRTVRRRRLTKYCAGFGSPREATVPYFWTFLLGFCICNTRTCAGSAPLRCWKVVALYLETFSLVYFHLKRAAFPHDAIFNSDDHTGEHTTLSRIFALQKTIMLVVSFLAFYSCTKPTEFTALPISTWVGNSTVPSTLGLNSGQSQPLLLKSVRVSLLALGLSHWRRGFYALPPRYRYPFVVSFWYVFCAVVCMYIIPMFMPQ